MVSKIRFEYVISGGEKEAIDKSAAIRKCRNRGEFYPTEKKREKCLKQKRQSQMSSSDRVEIRR